MANRPQLAIHSQNKTLITSIVVTTCIAWPQSHSLFLSLFFLGKEQKSRSQLHSGDNRENHFFHARAEATNVKASNRSETQSLLDTQTNRHNVVMGGLCHNDDDRISMQCHHSIQKEASSGEEESGKFSQTEFEAASNHHLPAWSQKLSTYSLQPLFRESAADRQKITFAQKKKIAQKL